MSDLKAVIIAAGRGVRMGPRGELMPKGLIQIDGVPLVQRSVSLLQARGVQHIRIVTGHLNDQYDAAFAKVEGVETVHNPAFATTGSLRSLATGLDGIHGPVAILESDLIYEAKTLDPITAPGSRILVSSDTNSGDEFYVWSRNGAAGEPIFDTMSKTLEYRPDPYFGELVGVHVFSAGDTEALKRASIQTLNENPKSDYEAALVAMAKGRDISCYRFEDLAWTEMDDEIMYANAANVVWPEIQKRDAAH